MEIWKDIEDFNGYKVSNYGRVYSEKRNKMLKPHKQRNGYLLYTMQKDSKSHYRYGHRLVAEHFIENPNDLPQVHHIDNDKTNNHVDNLMWVTAKENVNKIDAKSRKARGKNSMKNRYTHGKVIVEKINDEVSIGYLSIGQVPNINRNSLAGHTTRSKQTHFKCKGREFYCPK